MIVYSASLDPVAQPRDHRVCIQLYNISPSLSLPLPLPLPPSLQEFGFTDLGELQFEEDLCLDVSSQRPGAHVQILNCHGLGGNQKWTYDNTVGVLYSSLSSSSSIILTLPSPSLLSPFPLPPLSLPPPPPPPPPPLPLIDTCSEAHGHRTLS